MLGWCELCWGGVSCWCCSCGADSCEACCTVLISGFHVHSDELNAIQWISEFDCSSSDSHSNKCMLLLRLVTVT